LCCACGKKALQRIARPEGERPNSGFLIGEFLEITLKNELISEMRCRIVEIYQFKQD
jgi:hypothetical protein